MPWAPRPSCPRCGRLDCAHRSQRRDHVLTPAQRGYGHAHQLLRRRWMPSVTAGLVRCARCHLPIAPGQAWDLGHTDDRTDWTGPEHAHCNRSAAARKANAARSEYPLDDRRGYRRPWPRARLQFRPAEQP